MDSVPTINAALNLCATLLLIHGRTLVRRGQIAAHRRTMIAAFGVSTVFLVLYVAHKISRNFENTTLHVEGLLKSAYLVMLGSHVILATTVPVMAILLIRWGLRDERSKHRRLARIAWPIWMYVSVTGVLIYLVLYPLNPAP